MKKMIIILLVCLFSLCGYAATAEETLQQWKTNYLNLDVYEVDYVLDTTSVKEVVNNRVYYVEYNLPEVRHIGHTTHMEASYDGSKYKEISFNKLNIIDVPNDVNLGRAPMYQTYAFGKNYKGGATRTQQILSYCKGVPLFGIDGKSITISRELELSKLFEIDGISILCTGFRITYHDTNGVELVEEVWFDSSKNMMLIFELFTSKGQLITSRQITETGVIDNKTETGVIDNKTETGVIDNKTETGVIDNKFYPKKISVKKLNKDDGYNLNEIEVTRFQNGFISPDSKTEVKFKIGDSILDKRIGYSNYIKFHEED